MEVFILPVWAPALALLVSLFLHIYWVRVSKDYTLLPVILAEAWFFLVYLLYLVDAISNTERMAMIRGAISIVFVALALRTFTKIFGERIWNALSSWRKRHVD